MRNQNVFAILYVVGDDRSGLAEERIKQLTQQHALFALFRNQKPTKSEAIALFAWLYPRGPVDRGDRHDARTQFLYDY